MDFLEYWDSRITFWEKYPSIFDKPNLMNSLCDEARQAWEAALAEKERECERYLSLLIRPWPAGGWILHLPETGIHYFKEYSDAKQALEGKEGEP